MSPRAANTADPESDVPRCPKCRTPMRMTLLTTWGAYYACAPCDWQTYSTPPPRGRLTTPAETSGAA